MMDIKDKVENKEILYNDINKAKFELIPLFLKDKNVIKFKSYNELIHTIILLYLYIGHIFNKEVIVIDTISRTTRNKTYSSFVNPITSNPSNIINALRGRRFESDVIVCIKSDLEPQVADEILTHINMASKGNANIITCVL